MCFESPFTRMISSLKYRCHPQGLLRQTQFMFYFVKMLDHQCQILVESTIFLKLQIIVQNKMSALKIKGCNILYLTNYDYQLWFLFLLAWVGFGKSLFNMCGQQVG